jgi:very-short-patch-repair endonuclease
MRWSPRACSPPSAINVERAAVYRQSLTLSEARLWESLKGSRLGVGFRRQVPLGRYIADFVAPSCKLVVEVDGGYHAGRQAADARRDRALSRLGYRVLRVSHELVMQRHEEALGLIRAAVEAAAAEANSR